MNILNRQRGFTLIEILIIIGLIGVLISGIIILINPAKQLAKGRDSQRKADLKIIQQALELHYADNGYYPTWTDHPNSGWAPISTVNLNHDGITYLREVPTSPTSYNCDYVYATDRDSYVIFTILENAEDDLATTIKPIPEFTPSQYNSSDNITATWLGGSCSGGTYNYWVNSP